MSLGQAAPDHLALPNGVFNISGTATQGLGVPAIYKVGSLAAQTGAVASVTSLTPNTNGGTYLVFAQVNVTAWTTPASFNLEVTYTDNAGQADTVIMTVSRASNGATAAAITAIDVWSAIPLIIHANSAAITVLTTGTFTGSPVYNVDATIIQIA